MHFKEFAKRLCCMLERMKYAFRSDIYVGRRGNIRSSMFQDHIRLGDNCVIPGSFVGRYTYLGDNCNLPQTKIGAFCSIAPYVVLAAGSHPLHHASTSPITYRAAPYMGSSFLNESTFNEEFHYCDQESKYLCEIGNDVWIATRATLVCGRNALRIGDGAVVAAGAVVIEDVPPYAIVAGVPARIVKYRFSEDVVRKLELSHWWDKDDSLLKDLFPLFYDVDKTIERIVAQKEDR